jgi:hypothetical protein
LLWNKEAKMAKMNWNKAKKLKPSEGSNRLGKAADWYLKQQPKKSAKGAPSGKKAPEKAPICPTCSKPARLSPGKFGIKAECCGLWSWGFRPLVDRETHVARIQAHAAFDRLWKNGEMPRRVAYARLSDVMQMDRKDCHISLMTVDQAEAVIEHVRRGALSQDTREPAQGDPCDIWRVIGADYPCNPTPGVRVVQHITSLAEARQLGLR